MKRLVFILFVFLLLPLVLGVTTFFDNTDDFFIMNNIVTPGQISPPVGGGGGGGAPECLNDSDCSLGEFCFENRCYIEECNTDADCNDTKTCWMNMCVKLFDMQIVDVQSPINYGEFFDFTYFLKGVAEIHGDVIVRFWLVKDDKVVTEGFDTIYMGDFDEKTQTSKLFLPTSILDGVYNFYIEVNYDSYYARAGRMIEVGEAGLLGELLDVSFNLDKTVIQNSSELLAYVTFESFGAVPSNVDLTFTIIDEDGKEVYRKVDRIVVTTEEYLEWDYGNLNIPSGKYTAKLKINYGRDLFHEFNQDFTIKKGFFITGGAINQLGEGIQANLLLILIIGGLLILGVIIYWERKKIKNALIKEEKVLKKYKISILTVILFVFLTGILYYLNKTGKIFLPSLEKSFVDLYFNLWFLVQDYWISLLIIFLVLIGIFIVNQFWDKIKKAFLERYEIFKKHQRQIKNEKEKPSKILKISSFFKKFEEKKKKIELNKKREREMREARERKLKLERTIEEKKNEAIRERKRLENLKKRKKFKKNLKKYFANFFENIKERHKKRLKEKKRFSEEIKQRKRELNLERVTREKKRIEEEHRLELEKIRIDKKIEIKREKEKLERIEKRRLMKEKIRSYFTNLFLKFKKRRERRRLLKLKEKRRIEERNKDIKTRILEEHRRREEFLRLKAIKEREEQKRFEKIKKIQMKLDLKRLNKLKKIKAEIEKIESKRIAPAKNRIFSKFFRKAEQKIKEKRLVGKRKIQENLILLMEKEKELRRRRKEERRILQIKKQKEDSINITKIEEENLLKRQERERKERERLERKNIREVRREIFRRSFLNFFEKIKNGLSFNSRKKEAQEFEAKRNNFLEFMEKVNGGKNEKEKEFN